MQEAFCNTHYKESYVVHIRALKQALNHRLILKKLHRAIQFNQKKMVKTIYWHEHWIKKRCKKWFLKKFLQTHEECCFWKNNGKYKKA